MNIFKIELEGFGTFVKPFKFLFDQTGVNFIEGDNGTGKTTLIKEGLVWGLYGKTKKVNVATWESARHKGFKGTRVLIHFIQNNNKYIIARHIKYVGDTYGYKGGNNLMVFNANTEIPRLTGEHQNKPELQAYINELIGVDHKGFMSTVILAQNSAGLINAKDVEKRKIFEEIFGAFFLSEGAKIVDKMLKENADKSNEVGHLIDKLNINLELENQKLITQNIEYENFKKHFTLAIRDLKSDIQDLKQEIDQEQLYLLKLNLLLDSENVNYNSFVVPDITQIILQRADLEAQIQEQRSLYQITTELMNKEYAACENIKNIIPTLKQNKQSLEDQLINAHIALEKLKNQLDALECHTCGQSLTPEAKESFHNNIILQYQKNELEINHLQNKIADTGKTIGDKHRTLISRTKNKELYVNELKAIDNYVKSSSLKENIKKLDEQIKLNSALKDEKNALHINVMSAKNRVDKTQTKIDVLTNELKIKTDILQIKQLEKPPVDRQKEINQAINDLIGQLKISTEEQTKLFDRYLDLKFWKEGFSARGMKGYIFDTMLQKLNKTIETYTEQLNIGVKFGVDKTKANRPFTTQVILNNKVIPYQDLSGGEKQRVNLILPFAISDLLKNKLNINLFVLDESFSGLDEQGRNALVELIRIKSEYQAIYIITHNKIIDTLYSKTIKLNVVDGTTIISD